MPKGNAFRRSSLRTSQGEHLATADDAEAGFATIDTGLVGIAGAAVRIGDDQQVSDEMISERGGILTVGAKEFLPGDLLAWSVLGF